MKYIILFLLIYSVAISDDKTKTPTFKPTFIYERPDGSEYARIDGIEGWVILKPSKKPNPFFSTVDIPNQNSIMKNEKGETIIEVFETTPLNPSLAVNSSFVDRTFPVDLITLKVFPNPSTENSSISINLANEKNVKIELYTTTGKFVGFVQEGVLPKGDNIITIPTNKYYSGNYLVSVSIDGAKRMEAIKIVK